MSGDAQSYCQRAKGRPGDDKIPEDTNRQSDTGAGDEEARWRSTGGQELEAQPPSEMAGTGPQVKAVKGGGVGGGGGVLEEWQRKEGT